MLKAFILCLRLLHYKDLEIYHEKSESYILAIAQKAMSAIKGFRPLLI